MWSGRRGRNFQATPAPEVDRSGLRHSPRPLLVLIASAFMASFGARYRSACQQRGAVAVIRALDGGKVYYDAHCSHEHDEGQDWVWCQSRPAPVDPSDPTWARKLLGIDLSAAAVDLRAIEPPVDLSFGVIMPPPFGLPDARLEALLEPIVELTPLEFLEPSNAQITGRGLGEFRVSNRLWGLGLDFTRARDTDPNGVGGLACLRPFNPCCYNVTGPGLGRLRGPSDLCRANLARTHVTEEGVRNLRQAFRNF